MLNLNNKISARVLFETQDKNFVSRIFRFRKSLFVDELQWSLPARGEFERDDFDTADAHHCALLSGEQIVGGFRAIRCDAPYMAASVFPQLAVTRPYPHSIEAWEISRFGCQAQHRYLSPLLYALMFHFAISRDAKALVAMTDLPHERQLQRLGLRMVRYGPPRAVGLKPCGRPLIGVAGHIPLSPQNYAVMRNLIMHTHHMEMTDDTLSFRSRCLPPRPLSLPAG